MRALSDSSGSVVQVQATDAWGVVTQSQGSVSQPVGYTGAVQDPNGLVDLRARMYDPSSGRFLQADPLRKSGPGILGWNRYAYAGDNPANLIDPSGSSSSRALAAVSSSTTLGWGGDAGLCFPVWNPFTQTVTETCIGDPGGQTSTQTQTTSPAACPDESLNTLVGKIGPGSGTWDVYYRPASTDGGKQPCHVNVDIPIYGGGSYINWHIYYDQGFTAIDTGVGLSEDPGPRALAAADAWTMAGLIVDDLATRTSDAGSAAMGDLYGSIGAALEELQEIMTK